MIAMTSLLTKRQLADMGHFFKAVVVRILIVPFLVVLIMSLLMGVLGGLVGAPSAIVLNFVLEATGTVVVIQFKFLLIVGSIGAFCFVVGSYRLDVFASNVADKLQSMIKGLTLFWASMLASGLTLFLLPKTPEARVPAEALKAGVRAGFVAGESPQLE